jgi:hypothetical protein
VEQFDGKRELLVQRHLIPAARVELRRNVMRLERKVRASGHQLLPGASWDE